MEDQGSDVDIQPADPDVVYVPEYDPELIYGYPVGLWPGFYPWWGVGGPYLSFGVGFGIGPFFGFGWGWDGMGSRLVPRRLVRMVAALMRSTAMRSMTAMPTSMGTTEGGAFRARRPRRSWFWHSRKRQCRVSRAPVPLADSAAAETRGVFPREDGPASVEACMAVAEVDTEKQALTLGLTWAGRGGKGMTHDIEKTRF